MIEDTRHLALLQIWSNVIINRKYKSVNLKLAVVTPVFKKKDSTLAGNCRPVSVSPTVLKIFE